MTNSAKTKADQLTVRDGRGLPPGELYWPRRSVNLAPPRVRKALKDEGLSIPWHVIEAACAALDAGKHVIFTGPPGCGKSKARWRVGEAGDGARPTHGYRFTRVDVGRSGWPLPAQRDGAGLAFHPGFFLQAVDDDGKRWLVIDEFNRANIDECFGELFSVLADDESNLPFEDEVQGRGEDDQDRSTVR